MKPKSKKRVKNVQPVKGKDAYILEVIRAHLRRYVDKKARYHDDGILYFLKVGKKDFKRKFVTLKRAKRIFYELYPQGGN